MALTKIAVYSTAANNDAAIDQEMAAELTKAGFACFTHEMVVENGFSKKEGGIKQYAIEVIGAQWHDATQELFVTLDANLQVLGGKSHSDGSAIHAKMKVRLSAEKCAAKTYRSIKQYAVSQYKLMQQAASGADAKLAKLAYKSFGAIPLGTGIGTSKAVLQPVSAYSYYSFEFDPDVADLSGEVNGKASYRLSNVVLEGEFELALTAGGGEGVQDEQGVAPVRFGKAKFETAKEQEERLAKEEKADAPKVLPKAANNVQLPKPVVTETTQSTNGAAPNPFNLSL